MPCERTTELRADRVCGGDIQSINTDHRRPHPAKMPTDALWDPSIPPPSAPSWCSWQWQHAVNTTNGCCVRVQHQPPPPLQKRVGRRLEDVARAVGGGPKPCCRIEARLNGGALRTGKPRNGPNPGGGGGAQNNTKPTQGRVPHAC